MHSYILQDWTTIRAASGTVTQGESGWLDLAPYQDVMFWIDVREYSGATAPHILFQTAPIKEDALFTSTVAGLMADVDLSAVTNPKRVLITSSVPLARYVRWQLSGPGSAWDATFRVLVAANALGL